MATFSGRLQCKGCKGTCASKKWLYMLCCGKLVHKACWAKVVRPGKKKTPCLSCKTLVKRAWVLHGVRTVPDPEPTEHQAAYGRYAEGEHKFAAQVILLEMAREKVVEHAAETAPLKTRVALLEGQLSGMVTTLDDTKEAAAQSAVEAARVKAEIEEKLRATDEELGDTRTRATAATRAMLHRKHYPKEAENWMSVAEIAQMLEAGVTSKEVIMFAKALGVRNAENEDLKQQVAARAAELAACQQELQNYKMLEVVDDRSVAPDSNNMAQAGPSNFFSARKSKKRSKAGSS